MLLGTMAFAAGQDSAALPTLHSAKEVRGLPLAEAVRGYPVQLQATVLVYEHTESGLNVVFLYDGEMGVCAENKGPPVDLHTGDEIELEGVSALGGFAPYVVQMRFRHLGTAPLPPPRPITISEALSGHEDAQWVQIAGVVRSVYIQDKRLHFLLASGPQRIEVDFPGPCQEVPAGVPPVDADVTVSGAISPVFNAHHQLLSSTLYCPGFGAVQVLTRPPPDPFAVAALNYDDLLQYSPDRSSDHRVKVHGTVSFYLPGKAVFLAGQGRGLLLKIDQPVDLKVGDEVDALGFPVAGVYQAVLEDASFRRTGTSQTPPEVRSMMPWDALNGYYDSTLVRMSGTLVQQFQTNAEQVLVLRRGGMLFSAHLSLGTDSGFMPREGSFLQVTGICVAAEAMHPEIDEWRPKTVELLVASPADVVVLTAPPWWTRQRVEVAAGAGMATLALLLVWIYALRRQVRSQTAVIQEQLRWEATLQERNRIARELHDTLAQSFAGTAFALEGVASRLKGERHPIVPQVDMALQTVRNGLTEARRSLMNLRSVALEKTDIAAAIQEAAEGLVKGTPVRLRLRLAPLQAGLPAEAENDIYRIAVEAMTNAIRHGSPRNLEVELSGSEEAVTLRVVDDGAGFDAATAPPGHYGVQGMRERAEQIHGSLEIASVAGRGSDLRLTVPLPSQRNGEDSASHSMVDPAG